jgi:hypothetical protein
MMGNKDGKEGGLSQMLPFLLMSGNKEGGDSFSQMLPILMMQSGGLGGGSATDTLVQQLLFSKLGESNPQMKNMIQIMSIMGKKFGGGLFS